MPQKTPLLRHGAAVLMVWWLDGSDAALDGQHPGTHAQLGALNVELVQTVEHAVHVVVLGHHHHRRGQRGPRMGSIVWVASLAATALHLLPGCEATAS